MQAFFSVGWFSWGAASSFSGISRKSRYSRISTPSLENKKEENPVRVFLFLLLFGSSVLAFFGNTGSFTGKFTKVVEFCATHFTYFVNFDFVDERRVHREDTFNAYVVGHFANGETFCIAVAANFDNYTAETLDTLLVTLFNAVVNCNGVAAFERRVICLYCKSLFCNFN